MTRRCVVLLGPPGVGKGTQATRIAEATGLVALSTGDMLRAAAKEGTALGARVQQVMARGDLVDDATMIELVNARLDALAGRSVMLDGFPRTAEQARALDAALEARAMKVDAALAFRADAEALAARLAGRRAEAGAGSRADDAPEAIARRMEVYEASAAPTLKHYEARGALAPVDASGAPDAVYALAMDALARAGVDAKPGTR